MPHLIEHEIDANDPAYLYLNLHSNEEIKLVVRHHWGGFLGTLGLVVAMGLFPLIILFVVNLAFAANLNSLLPIVIIALSGYYLFLLTFLFGAWINYYYDILFITNERILNVAQEGLLARKVSELNLKQVQNVTAQIHGFLQTFLSYGHLVIETAGEGTTDDRTRPGLQGYFTIHDLPDVNRLARTIIELHRQAEKNAPN